MLCPVFCCLWGREPAVGLCQSSACVPMDRAPRRECRTPTLCSLCPPAAPPGAPGRSVWTLSGAARVLSPAGALRAVPAPRTPAPDSHCPWRRSRTECSHSQEHAALQSATPRAALRASPLCWRRPPSAHTPSVYARPFWPLRSRRAERAPPQTSCGRQDWRRAGICHLKHERRESVKTISGNIIFRLFRRKKKQHCCSYKCRKKVKHVWTKDTPA